MSDQYNLKTVQSIKPGYTHRPEPRDLPPQFQEVYVEACREVNELLLDADRYFAFDEVQDVLQSEEENFRQDNDYSLEITEVVEESDLGDLVVEGEFYEQLVGFAGSEIITDLSDLASTVLRTSSARDSIGQAMDYDSPVSWMMYKREAYNGQDVDKGDPNNEIATIGDLRRHADGQDLCKKRYDFLKQFNQEHADWSIESETDFPDSTPLEEVYTDERVLSLIVNEDFMGEVNDGANVVNVFGESITPIELKEGGRGSWLGNEKDMDGKWANF